MRADEIIRIRDEISALLLAKVDGDYHAEHHLIVMAGKQLEQMTCLGGSTRAYGEQEIVRLARRFDDTRQSGFGPWPVSAWMIEVEGREVKMARALQACIDAHKTGRYDPIITAIEAAENLLKSEADNG